MVCLCIIVILPYDPLIATIGKYQIDTANMFLKRDFPTFLPCPLLLKFLKLQNEKDFNSLLLQNDFAKLKVGQTWTM